MEDSEKYGQTNSNFPVIFWNTIYAQEIDGNCYVNAMPTANWTNLSQKKTEKVDELG